MESLSVVNSFETIKDFCSNCFCFLFSNLIVFIPFYEQANPEAYHFIFGTWKKLTIWFSAAEENIHIWHSLHAVRSDQIDAYDKSVKCHSLLGLVTAGDDFQYKLIHFTCDLTKIGEGELTISIEKSYPLSIFHSNAETVARLVENENADLYIVINWMMSKNPERTRFHVFDVKLDKSGNIEDIPLLIHLGQLGGYWHQPFVTAKPYAVNFLSAYGSPDEMMTFPLDGVGALPEQHAIAGNCDRVGEAYPPSGVPSGTVRIKGDFVNIVYGMGSGNYEMWTLNWKLRKYTHSIPLSKSENQAKIEQPFLESAFAFDHLLIEHHDGREKLATLDLEQISAAYCQKKVRILYGANTDKKEQCFKILYQSVKDGLNGLSKNSGKSENEIKVFLPKAKLADEFFQSGCHVFDIDVLCKEIEKDNKTDLFIYNLGAFDSDIKEIIRNRYGNTVIALSKVVVNGLQQPQDVFCWHCFDAPKNPKSSHVKSVRQGLASSVNTPQKNISSQVKLTQQEFLKRAKKFFTSNYPNWEKDAKTTTIFMPELEDFIGIVNNDNESQTAKRSRKRVHPEAIFATVSDNFDDTPTVKHEKSLFNVLKSDPIGGILIHKLDINQLMHLGKTVSENESEEMELEVETTTSVDSGYWNFVFLRPFSEIYLIEIKEENEMEISDQPQLSQHDKTEEKIAAIRKVYKQITGSQCNSKVCEIIWCPNGSTTHLQSTNVRHYFDKTSTPYDIWQHIKKLINEINDSNDAIHFASFVYALSCIWKSSNSIDSNIMRVYKSLEKKVLQQKHFEKNSIPVIHGFFGTGKTGLLISRIMKASLEDKPLQKIRVILPNHQLCALYEMTLQRMKKNDEKIARAPIITTKFFADDTDDLFCDEIPLNNAMFSFLRYRLTVPGSTAVSVSGYGEITAEFSAKLQELCRSESVNENDRKFEILPLTEILRSAEIVENWRSDWSDHQSASQELKKSFEHLSNEIKRHLPFSYGDAKQWLRAIGEMKPKHIAVITTTRELAENVKSYLSSAPSNIPCGSIIDQLHDGDLIAVAAVQDAVSFNWPFVIVLENSNTSSTLESFQLFAYSRAIVKRLVIQLPTDSVQTSVDVACQSIEINRIEEAFAEVSTHSLDEFKELQIKQWDWIQKLKQSIETNRIIEKALAEVLTHSLDEFKELQVELWDWVQKFIKLPEHKITSFQVPPFADFNRYEPSAD